MILGSKVSRCNSGSFSLRCLRAVQRLIHTSWPVPGVLYTTPFDENHVYRSEKNTRKNKEPRHITILTQSRYCEEKKTRLPSSSLSLSANKELLVSLISQKQHQPSNKVSKKCCFSVLVHFVPKICEVLNQKVVLSSCTFFMDPVHIESIIQISGQKIAMQKFLTV